MQKKPSPSIYKVYFIGIGGIGTSALARWFLRRGYLVSGSDSSSSQITRELEKERVRIFIGHKAKNLPSKSNLVVYSAAIPPNNPELKKARISGIKTSSYAEALGDVSRKYKTIAVAGAHGKSTSTALLSLALIKGGFDPTVIVGTKLKEFNNRNFRSGRSQYLILEADEYHKSFLNYSPSAVLITNIDREHLDFYKNLGEIKRIFLKFILSIKLGGIVVLNKDDKNLSSLKNGIVKIAKRNNLTIEWYGLGIPRLKSIKNKIRKIIKIPGEHNISNALGVYVLARKLGAKDSAIFRALGTYRGAWRRMEYRGELKTKNSKLKAMVYDDYAHHPTEIRATLSGIAQKWPKSGLICIFQPHQAKRLKVLFKEFTTAFDDAHSLVLLDIYKVPGRDTKLSHNIDSERLAVAINRHLKQVKNRKKWPLTDHIRLKKVVYLPYLKRLRETLEVQIRNSKWTLRGFVKGENEIRNSWIVVMMGAGDIVKYTDFLLKSNLKDQNDNSKFKKCL